MPSYANREEQSYFDDLLARAQHTRDPFEALRYLTELCWLHVSPDKRDYIMREFNATLEEDAAEEDAEEGG
jgi:hypothetical protein